MNAESWAWLLTKARRSAQARGERRYVIGRRWRVGAHAGWTYHVVKPDEYVRRCGCRWCRRCPGKLWVNTLTECAPCAYDAARIAAERDCARTGAHVLIGPPEHVERAHGLDEHAALIFPIMRNVRTPDGAR